MPQFYSQFEETLAPLLRLMIEPEKITFEDDIVLLIKSFIRKKKEVSPMMWELLTVMPKVLTKNKEALGNVFETLNFYLIHGRQQLA